MKTNIFIVALFAILLAACGSSGPAYIDNGNPGQVNVIVFYDDNRNGAQDVGESGAPVEVGISQDISCPASSLDKNTFSSTDENGTTLFNGLKPGLYCIALNGNYNMTTKATVELYVSSDQRATIHFGIVRE